MNIERFVASACFLSLTLAGCSGGDGAPGGSKADTEPPIRKLPDSGNPSGDGGSGLDGLSGLDGRTGPDGCTGLGCPLPDSGQQGDVSPECRGVTCSGHGTCSGGTCICDPGYRPDPQDRTKCISTGGGPDAGGGDVPSSRPCRGINCSGHGTCYATDAGQPKCNCNPGYKAQGVICIAVDKDGDGSPDNRDCAPNNPNRGHNLQEQCRDGVDNNCDQRVDENCGGGGSGQLTCYQLVQCTSISCPQNAGRQCVQRQLMKGTQTAQSRYRSLANCATQNCPQGSPPNCLENRCSRSYNSCFPRVTGRNVSCWKIFLCLQHCRQGDQSCNRSCTQRGSPTGQQQATALSTCVRNSCPQSSTRCIRRNCGPQFRQCFGC